MSSFVRVKAVEPRDKLTVRVQFTNGEERDIDLAPYIGDGPIFRPLRDDPALFRAVTVEGGTIAWPNGADIDPDVLYLGLPPNASQEQWEAARDAVASAPRA